MTATVGSIAIDLVTNAVKFAAGFKGAASVVQAESARMAASVARAETSLLSMARTARFGVGALGGLAASLGTSGIAKFADQWTRAGNEIRSAAEVSGIQTRSLSELNDIAFKTRSGLSETVRLYTRLARSAETVSASEEEIARVTELTAKAFKAGGAATSEQIAGILQLSQALASGVLAGDELRSIRENAPLIAKAIADEFGVTIGQLKKLGSEGELTSKRVLRAILNGADEIEKAFAVTIPTVADGVGQVYNALTELVGTLNDGTGASRDLTTGLLAIAGGMKDLASSIGEIPVEKLRTMYTIMTSIYSLIGARVPGTLTDALGDLNADTIKSIRDEYASLTDAISEQQKIVDNAKSGNDPFFTQIAIDNLDQLQERADVLRRTLEANPVALLDLQKAEEAGRQLDTLTGQVEKVKQYPEVYRAALDEMKELLRLFGEAQQQLQMDGLEDEALSNMERYAEQLMNLQSQVNDMLTLPDAPTRDATEQTDILAKDLQGTLAAIDRVKDRLADLKLASQDGPIDRVGIQKAKSDLSALIARLRDIEKEAIRSSASGAAALAALARQALETLGAIRAVGAASGSAGGGGSIESGSSSGGGELPKFARGGVSSRPAIFGDAGPEAAVPLPDGRSIPVALSGAGMLDNISANTRDMREQGQQNQQVAKGIALDVGAVNSNLVALTNTTSEGLEGVEKAVREDNRPGGDGKAVALVMGPGFMYLFDSDGNLVGGNTPGGFGRGPGYVTGPGYKGTFQDREPGNASSFFGFASGGIIDGDSQMVQFLKGPAEKVIIARPDQLADFRNDRHNGDQGRAVSVGDMVFNVQGDMDRRAAMQIRDMIRREMIGLLDPVG